MTSVNLETVLPDPRWAGNPRASEEPVADLVSGHEDVGHRIVQRTGQLSAAGLPAGASVSPAAASDAARDQFWSTSAVYVSTSQAHAPIYPSGLESEKLQVLVDKLECRSYQHQSYHSVNP